MGDLVLGFETVMSEAKVAGIAEQDHTASGTAWPASSGGLEYILDDEATEMEKLESHLLRR